MANDETSQFISGMFVNSLALPAPGNTPGIRLQTRFDDKLSLQFALASKDNSGNRVFEDLFTLSGWCCTVKQPYTFQNVPQRTLLRHQLNTWTHISGHLQVVRNEIGSSGKTDVILGMRTQFDF